MPTIFQNRDVYLGEPIDSLTANVEDQFYLKLKLYDDQGAAWPDNYTVNLYAYFSERDTYSGSGTEAAHFSGTTSSGSANVFISMDTPGNYFVEIVISSGSGVTDPVITAGTFDFIVTGD